MSSESDVKLIAVKSANGSNSYPSIVREFLRGRTMLIFLQLVFEEDDDDDDETVDVPSSIGRESISPGAKRTSN